MKDAATDFQRDLFLCHAHADKELFVRPLADELRKYGVSCWLDEAEIALGDHIAARINDGLRYSRFVLVFVTPNFIERNWPLVELYAAFGIEVRKGEVVVLLVLAISDAEWKNCFPLLAEKKYVSWSMGVDHIAQQITKKVSQTFEDQ